MSRFRIPTTLPDMQLLIKKLEEEFQRIDGTRNVDMRGRRYMNAGNAQADQDYTTLRDVKALLASYGLGNRPRSVGIGTGAIGTGTGSGGGGGDGGPAPTVPLPDESATVQAYAAANPTQLEDSCQRDGGTWDFMDGVVLALQAIDTRWGYNAKRGVCTDPSLDAVSYYHGPLGMQQACDPRVYVVDIIGCHCGPEDGAGCTPYPAWKNQTGVGGAGGGWLLTRP